MRGKSVVDFPRSPSPVHARTRLRRIHHLRDRFAGGASVRRIETKRRRDPMSLILEALKKSEQQRRIGQVPNLGTPVIGTRRRRSLLPVLALLIVVALAVGAWMRFAPSPSGQPGSATPTETTKGELAASDAANPPPAATSAPDKAPAPANPQPTRPLSAYERERLRLTGE